MSHITQPQVPRPSASVVVSRLSGLYPLSDVAKALICSLDVSRTWRAGAELIGERETIKRHLFLAAGWAARIRILSDGRRQLLGFLTPGDGLGLCQRRRPLALTTTLALTPVRTLDASPVMRAIEGEGFGDVAEALLIASALEEANLLDQVVRLGRQTAYERLAHLLLELHHRLLAVGLASESGFAMPLTQEVLADATGLSIVHVNRVLQQMRREHLLQLQAGQLRFPDRQRLADIADYRPPQPSAWRGVAGQAC
jgi:CRP-like cAMP-binding protein